MTIAWLTLLLGIGLMGGMLVLASHLNEEEKRRQHRHGKLQGMRIERGMMMAAGPVTSEQGTSTQAMLPAALRTRLARADIQISPSQMFIFLTVLTVATTLGIVGAGFMIGLMIGGAITGGAWFMLEFFAGRRLKGFVESLPAFFDRVRQLVVVGNTLQQALSRATETAPPEVQRYFVPLVRRLRHGSSVPEALQWMSNRLDLPELHMFTSAVDTNIRYGGRISDILENLIRILRDRSKVERELRSATAETRMSAQVLMGLPIVVAIAILFVNPGYLPYFWEEESGQNMLMLIIGLQCAGVYAMQKLSKVTF